MSSRSNTKFTASLSTRTAQYASAAERAEHLTNLERIYALELMLSQAKDPPARLEAELSQRVDAELDYLTHVSNYWLDTHMPSDDYAQVRQQLRLEGFVTQRDNAMRPEARRLLIDLRVDVIDNAQKLLEAHDDWEYRDGSTVPISVTDEWFYSDWGGVRDEIVEMRRRSTPLHLLDAAINETLGYSSAENPESADDKAAWLAALSDRVLATDRGDAITRVDELVSLLSAARPTDLGERIVLLHRAVTTAHSNGPMATRAYGRAGLSTLTRLSNEISSDMQRKVDRGAEGLDPEPLEGGLPAMDRNDQAYLIDTLSAMPTPRPEQVERMLRQLKPGDYHISLVSDAAKQLANEMLRMPRGGAVNIVDDVSVAGRGPEPTTENFDNPSFAREDDIDGADMWAPRRRRDAASTRMANPQGHELGDLTDSDTDNHAEAPDRKIDTNFMWSDSYRSENQYEDPNLKLGARDWTSTEVSKSAQTSLRIESLGAVVRASFQREANKRLKTWMTRNFGDAGADAYSDIVAPHKQLDESGIKGYVSFLAKYLREEAPETVEEAKQTAADLYKIFQRVGDGPPPAGDYPPGATVAPESEAEAQEPIGRMTLDAALSMSASPKKVEFLKKQHPKAAPLIDWLAAHDPTKPRYEALPVMWAALKSPDNDPARIVQKTLTFYRSQPYAEWFSDAQQPWASNLKEYLAPERRYMTLEDVARDKIRSRLPALRGATEIGNSFSESYENAELGAYVRRELQRAIIMNEGWGLPKKHLSNLMRTIQLTGDEADDKTTIRQAIDTISAHRPLIKREKPETFAELDALVTAGGARGGIDPDNRPDGIVDHGDGVTEYMTRDAAVAECASETKWCWAYRNTSTYWNSYSAANRIFRVDLAGVPRGPFGTVVSRSSNRVGETRDRNDNLASGEVKERIIRLLAQKDLAVLPSSMREPDDAPVAEENMTPREREDARWAAEGLNREDFNPDRPSHDRRALTLEQALDFVNHGFTPQEAAEWSVLRTLRGQASVMNPEELMRIKEHPIWTTMTPSSMVSALKPSNYSGLTNVNSIGGARLDAIFRELPNLSLEEAQMAVELSQDLRENRVLTPREFGILKEHLPHLQEARDRKYLRNLWSLLTPGSPTSISPADIPRVVEEMRGEPFPSDVLFDRSLNQYRRPGRDGARTLALALEQAGLPRDIATTYANVARYEEDDKVPSYLDFFKPLVDAMVEEKVFIPRPGKNIDPKGLADVIRADPQGVKLAMKHGFFNSGRVRTGQELALAVQWAPLVKNRFVTVYVALHEIAQNQPPPSDPMDLMPQRIKGGV